jgi:hypothetical protein
MASGPELLRISSSNRAIFRVKLIIKQYAGFVNKK